MRLYEHQAKQLLAEAGVSVPRGREVRTADEATRAFESLARAGASVCFQPGEIGAVVAATLTRSDAASVN